MSDGASSEDKSANKPEWFRGLMVAIPFAVVFSLTFHNIALGVGIAGAFAAAFATAFRARKGQ
jgi:hypothetical protein